MPISLAGVLNASYWTYTLSPVPELEYHSLHQKNYYSRTSDYNHSGSEDHKKAAGPLLDTTSTSPSRLSSGYLKLLPSLTTFYTIAMVVKQATMKLAEWKRAPIKQHLAPS